MPDQQSGPAVPAGGSIVLRVIWVGALPAIVFCVCVVADTPPWTFSGYDYALVLVVLAAIVARTIDVLRYGGKTTDGRPGRPRHVIAYAIRVIVVTVAAWVIAQSIEL